MLIKLKEHYDYIEGLIKEEPDLVLASTFNIHAGVLHDGRDTTDWGPRYWSRTHEVMDLLDKQKRVHILVGVPGFYPPDPACQACRHKRSKALQKYLAHKDRWPNIRWKVAREAHMKAFLTVKGKKVKGVAGGRNLTDSAVLDVSFALSTKDAKLLAKHFVGAWEKADPLDGDTVERYYDEDVEKQVEKLDQGRLF